MNYTGQCGGGVKNNVGEPLKDGRNISVIMQGACSDITPSCLKSLRTVFPRAEIIVSTWQNSVVDSVYADQIIFSEDPGTVYADQVSKTLNNVNRQLISTKAGLAAATRPFTLKTRSDILFQNADFLAYFGKYDQYKSSYFQNRLLICNYYTRNPQVSHICFHPSDWILFGRTEDVVQYYKSIPCMTQEEGAWFEERPKLCTIFTNYLCRYTPEQHIFLNFIRHHYPVRCDCYYDYSRELAGETERALVDCFVVLDYQKHLAISFPKYDPNRFLEKYTLISHWQWRAIYNNAYRHGSVCVWWLYQIRIVLLETLMHMRRISVRILDSLGIKEQIKQMLSHRGKGCN